MKIWLRSTIICPAVRSSRLKPKIAPIYSRDGASCRLEKRHGADEDDGGGLVGMMVAVVMLMIVVVRSG